jgi:hypothetical protein
MGAVYASKKACYQKTGEFLSALASPAERAGVRAHIEREYVAACRQSAGLDRAT